MIYVSTGGYKNRDFEEAIDELCKVGIVAFELSGGKSSNDVLNKLKYLSKKYSITLHNYFPPPKNSFVLNLASFQDNIIEASFNHIIKAVDISHYIGAKFYSFHAGYLVDPPVTELGVKIEKQVINDRQKGINGFMDRANKLAAYAEGKGVKLLVENNVLTKANYESFGENPFLMVDQDETLEIMNKSHHNLGLLIDVAHLKVSANTLNFSAVNYLKSFYNSVCAYHFSDNLGLEDSNNLVGERSWFWPYVNKNLDYYSLEVYSEKPKNLIRQINIIRKMLT